MNEREFEQRLDELDAELKALAVIARLLADLPSDETRRRVLSYLVRRFGGDQ